MIDKKTSNAQPPKNLLEARIKKSLNSSIAYGLTTIGLLTIGLFLNSQSSIDQSQILQYSRSIIFALTMPFAIATTNSYLDYQSSRDFPSSATKKNPRAIDYYKSIDLNYSQTITPKSANKKLQSNNSIPESNVKEYCAKKVCTSHLENNKSL
jgi:hypothetical protein